jgi:hypothetical protein
MLTYANDLISKRQGRATYAIEFSHHDCVRNELAEKVIAAHKAAHASNSSKKKPDCLSSQALGVSLRGRHSSFW